LIDEFGIDRRAVVMELTESSAAERLEALYANMRELREGGIRIAIDDLGSGFNSLELFAGLPCDIVKMNRTLVPAGRDDFRRRAIVEGLVRMCECLEIGLVAEGIESEEQHRLIADAGASHAQGFRYAFPALAERVVERFPDGKVALGG
jgi:EAL domain-containing protein (putative c-di-GMP-specific phosphodiesterase class I)